MGQGETNVVKPATLPRPLRQRTLAGVIRKIRRQTLDRFLMPRVSCAFIPRRYQYRDPRAVTEAARRQAGRLMPLSAREAVAHRLRQQAPDAIPATMAAAEAVGKGIFTLFGKSFSPGSPPAWNRDPRVGFEWPMKFHADLDHLTPAAFADPKWPWELSSFRHALALGQAFWLTGDERYAGQFAAQVDAWSAANPPGRGINWNGPMEVAIRAINLTWGYSLISSASSLSESFHRLFLNLMYSHAAYLARNMENTGPVTNNHYACNLLGLLTVAAVFPVFRHSRRWQAQAVAGLVREGPRQVHADGTNVEASTAYHQLVADIFLHAAHVVGTLRLASDTGAEPRARRAAAQEALGPGFLKRLEQMFEFILTCTRPDGSTPQIGDNDSSRLMWWRGPGYPDNDYRNLLATAGEFFDRDDFRRAGQDALADAIWLFQGCVRPPTEPAPPERSRAFPDSGFYVMRGGAHHLVVRCGPLGTGGRGGHTHNDNLSFDLFAGGRHFLVDPGTGSYTGDPELRNRFRSTAAHNTVMIDDREQNRFDTRELFAMQANSSSVVRRWEPGSDTDVWTGEVAYDTEAGAPWVHRRTITFHRNAGTWRLEDAVVGTGTHTLTWRFHAAPGLACRREGDRMLLSPASGPGLSIVPSGPAGWEWQIQSGWYSVRYGDQEPAMVVALTMRAELPITFTFHMMVHEERP